MKQILSQTPIEVTGELLKNFNQTSIPAKDWETFLEAVIKVNISEIKYVCFLVKHNNIYELVKLYTCVSYMNKISVQFKII